MWSRGLEKEMNHKGTGASLPCSLKKRIRKKEERKQKQTNEMKGIEFKQFSLGGREDEKLQAPLAWPQAHIHSLDLCLSPLSLSRCEIFLPFTIPWSY